MADRGRGKNRPTAHDSPRALLDALPHGPVESSTGTVELRRERDDPTGVTVVVNGVPSSHLDLANPRRLEFEYMQQMAAILDTWDVPGGSTAPLRAVHLGAAGCSMVRYLDATRPNSRNIAVEIDARLTELVRAWFQLPRAPALRLRTGDARVELSALPTASADVVIRDVFAGNATPVHVRTAEFVADVHRVLRPDGLYLANVADRPPLTEARREMATIAMAFASVGVIAEPGQLRSRRYGNLVVVGTDDAAALGSPTLARTLRCLPAPARLLSGADATAFASGAAPWRDD
jgi:SAM-dependent methyltransferase